MAKEVKKPSKKSAVAAGRVRKLTRKQASGKAKKEIKSRKPLPGSFKLTWQVVQTLKQHWKPLGGIVLAWLDHRALVAPALVRPCKVPCLYWRAWLLSGR
jgi:hypothetical protein